MRLLLAKYEQLGGVFRGGRALEAIELSGPAATAGATLRFEGGLVVAADSVVGADGIHSAVRAALLDQTPSEYAGASIVYGLLPGKAGLVADDPDAFHLCIGEEFSLLSSHYRGAHPATWFAVLTKPAERLAGRSLWSAAGQSDAAAGALEHLRSSP